MDVHTLGNEGYRRTCAQAEAHTPSQRTTTSQPVRGPHTFKLGETQLQQVGSVRFLPTHRPPSRSIEISILPSRLFGIQDAIEAASRSSFPFARNVEFLSKGIWTGSIGTRTPMVRWTRLCLHVEHGLISAQETRCAAAQFRRTRARFLDARKLPQDPCERVPTVRRPLDRGGRACC